MLGAVAKLIFRIPAAPLINPPVPPKAVLAVTVPLLVKVPVPVTVIVAAVKVNAPLIMAVPVPTVRVSVREMPEVVVQDTVPDKLISFVTVVTAQTTAPEPVKFKVS